MGKYGNSYSGNDFLEWWKHHYGTEYNGETEWKKTGTMTDEDYAIGQALWKGYQNKQAATNDYNSSKEYYENYYGGLIDSSDKGYDQKIGSATSSYNNSSAALKNAYDSNVNLLESTHEKNISDLNAGRESSLAALDKSKRNYQQSASITYDKLRKYLPTQIKAQGLGGLGVSESTMLQAQNNYVNNMGTIEANYNDNKTNIETNYNANKTAFETQKMETQSKLDSAYSEDKSNLDNAYNQNIADLNLGKQAASEAYTRQKTEQLSDLERAYNQKIENAYKDENGNYLVQNVLDKYGADLKADQTTAYNLAVNAINNKTDTISYDDMKSFIDTNYKGKVSDAQYEALLSIGESVVGNNEIAVKNSLYDELALTISTQFESYLSSSDDNKISQSEYDSLKNLVDSNKEALGAYRHQQLTNILNGYQLNIRDEKTQEIINDNATKYNVQITNASFGNANATYADEGEGDNFKVKYNGESYRVEKGKGVSKEFEAHLNQQYKYNDANPSRDDPKLGSTIICNGFIYMYLPVSKKSTTYSWYVVQGRAWGERGFKALCEDMGVEYYSRGSKDNYTP